MSSIQEEIEKNNNQWTSYWVVDALVGAVIFLIGVAVMIDSHRIGAGWLDGNLQAGYFPFRIGAILCLASVVVILSALFGNGKSTKLFVKRSQLKLVLTIFIPSLLYIFVTQFVGIYIASMLFVGGFMRLSKRTNWWKTISVSVGFSLVLFILFEVIFLMPLPKGPIESFLGY